MAAGKQKNSPKIGRGKRPGEAAKRGRYRQRTWARHKLKRILRGNGPLRGFEWAKENMCLGIYREITTNNKRLKEREEKWKRNGWLAA